MPEFDSKRSLFEFLQFIVTRTLVQVALLLCTSEPLHVCTLSIYTTRLKRIFPPLSLPQHACGFEYVARLQRMVVDMKLSEDCMTSFQEHLSLSSSSLPLAFSTLVLQVSTCSYTVDRCI